MNLGDSKGNFRQRSPDGARKLYGTNLRLDSVPDFDEICIDPPATRVSKWRVRLIRYTTAHLDGICIGYVDVKQKHVASVVNLIIGQTTKKSSATKS